MSDKIAYRFTGKKDADGLPVEYLGGIPAAHLTEDDYAALTKEQKEAVKASSLYKSVDSAPSSTAVTPAPKPTP